MKSTLTSMHAFVARLSMRYRAIAAVDKRLSTTVQLGEHVLRDQLSRRSETEEIINIGIIGPTQAGKSTLVNLMLRQPIVDASAIAGFTRKSTGVAVNCQQIYPKNQTHEQDVAQEKIIHIDSRYPCVSPRMIWDTPDFDSHHAREYSDEFLSVLARCDALIVVLSKEKYADQSVWEVLKILRLLQTPLMFCVNKLPQQAVQQITSALEVHIDKYDLGAQVRGIVSLPYTNIAQGGSKSDFAKNYSALLESEAVSTLGQYIEDAEVVDYESRAKKYLSYCWNEWLAPVDAELQGLAVWEQEISQVIEVAIGQYNQLYLQHPQQYQSFKQAIVELLRLLEIPVLAQPIENVRKVITWPLKKVLSVVSGSMRNENQGHQNVELDVLTDVTQQALITLRKQMLTQAIDDKQRSHWWLALSEKFDQEQADIEAKIEQSVQAYQLQFKEQIDIAANKLYKALQKDPITLNSLRVARVGSDLAAVVLALKTGGIGINDLILTPALLSVTSLLAEGAVGQYMKTVEKELKVVQLEQVTNSVLKDTFSILLVELVNQLESEELIGIDGETLSQAQHDFETYTGISTQ